MSTDTLRNLPVDRRRRRLIWVKFLRRTLPVAAGVALLSVVGQVSWRSFQAATAPAPAVSETTVRMVNPQFSGAGRDGARYVVTAISGVRDPKDTARIVLDKPTVDVVRPGEAATHTVSQRGVFREDDRSLSLSGDVRVAQAGGFNFVADTAVIDTATGKVVGGDVKGQGPAGDVQSGSYAVTGKGDRLVFKGGVHSRIEGR